ncbi:hypothetical protein ColTof4_03472 [Colletotrichum tofieldiae]|nr:hypothetical protein ColTof4_03472 [Colletotrichum tofieldiae]
MESPMDTEDTDLKGYYSEYHSQTSLDELLSRMGNFAKRHENAMAIMIGLLWNGADPTPEDKEGRRPYWYAEANGWLNVESPHTQIIASLLDVDNICCGGADDLLEQILTA